MKVTNKLIPDSGQEKLLSQKGPEGPVFMINLVKFKDTAIYDDKRDTNLSGREAYRLYGQEVVKMLPKYNAEVVFGTHITELFIGQVDDLWDGSK